MEPEHHQEPTDDEPTQLHDFSDAELTQAHTPVSGEDDLTQAYVPPHHEDFPSFWDAPPPEPVHEDPKRRGRAFAIFLAALLGASAGTAGTYIGLRNRVGAPGTVQVVAPPVTQATGEPANPVAAVAATVLPSIV